MRARAVILGVIGWVGLSTGCAGTGEFTEPAPEKSDKAPVASTVAERIREPSTEHHFNLVVRNYNLTLSVHDPGKAMEHAEKIFVGAGAEVMHSDRNEDTASISVTLPRGTSQKVIESLRVIGKVTNENTGVNDMRTAMHELRTKIGRLRIGEMAIAELIRETTDADVVDALVAQLDLSRREYDSARQQMTSYETQGRGDNLYVNFNKAVADPVPEPEPAPQLRRKE